MRPRAHSGIARGLATQSSEEDSVHPMPASRATTKNTYGRWTKAIRQQSITKTRFANVVIRCGEYLARAHGMMKAPLMTEPTAILVKRNPRWDALRCNSFRPTTVINSGMIAIKKENNAWRAKRTLIPGGWRTERIAV